MRIVAGLALAALLAAPALAQTTSSMPAAAAKASTFSADTPLAALVADAAAKAVLDTDLPGVSKHPSFEQFKAMSVRQLQPYAGGKITDDQVAKIDADLKALPAKP